MRCNVNEAGFARMPFEVSPDGKDLFIRPQHLHLSRRDFKLVGTASTSLSRILPAWSGSVGSDLDLTDSPARYLDLQLGRTPSRSQQRYLESAGH